MVAKKRVEVNRSRGADSVMRQCGKFWGVRSNEKVTLFNLLTAWCASTVLLT